MGRRGWRFDLLSMAASNALIGLAVIGASLTKGCFPRRSGETSVGAPSLLAVASFSFAFAFARSGC